MSTSRRKSKSRGKSRGGNFVLGGDGLVVVVCKWTNNLFRGATMKKHLLLVCCVSVFFVAVSVMAQQKAAPPAPPAPPPPPAAQPQDPELDKKVAKLIKQLDDDNWERREAAVAELEKIGKPALPQLKVAMRNSGGNAELQARLEKLLYRLSRRRLRLRPQWIAPRVRACT